MANSNNVALLAESQKEGMRERKKTGSKNKFISRDKENICLFNEDVPSNGNIVSKSPLPPDYPRIPLQDITAVLSPVNVMKVDEGEDGKEKSLPTLSKVCKAKASCTVQFELSVVESKQASTKELAREKTSEDVAQVADVCAVTALECTKGESEGQLASAQEAEDCAPVQHKAKRRRPEPKAPTRAGKSTSMLKFR